MRSLRLALASEHTDAAATIQETEPAFQFIPQKRPNRLVLPFDSRQIGPRRLNRLAFAAGLVRLEVDQPPSYGSPADRVNHPNVRSCTRERPHAGDFVVPFERPFDLLKQGMGIEPFEEVLNGGQPAGTDLRVDKHLCGSDGIQEQVKAGFPRLASSPPRKPPLRLG
jgi:hypothetical protein